QEILFATGNPNKVKEINHLLKDSVYSVKSLKEMGIETDIPEPFDTLRENAQAKVDYLIKLKGTPCISEDTGLEVKALNGAPGVLSARYAGESKNAADNIRLLLKNLEGINERTARFRTVICYWDGIQYHFFEGIVNGSIAEKPKGVSGFGYDPVFIPENQYRTFAEMTANEKINLSHRSRAFNSFLNFLKKQDD
ncbi:MAG: RdgB/HAM1 family non-canonical purine NTP pyrophosphatase, partial [Chitinophagales bacterium]